MKICLEEKSPWPRDDPGIGISVSLQHNMRIGTQGVMEDDRDDEDARKQTTATELMMMTAERKEEIKVANSGGGLQYT